MDSEDKLLLKLAFVSETERLRYSRDRREIRAKASSMKANPIVLTPDELAGVVRNAL